MLKHLIFLTLFQVVRISVLAYCPLMEKSNGYIKKIDTVEQLQTNRLTMAEKQLYTLKISPGKIVNALCDSLTLYNLTATLSNSTEDTLYYIDWTENECIWYFDKDRLQVHPSDYNFCSQVETHNYITGQMILPHKSKNIELSVRLDGGLSPLGKPFKIGVILQRIVTKRDFGLYDDYFAWGNHSLRRQTINLIWSNTIQMTK